MRIESQATTKYPPLFSSLHIHVVSCHLNIATTHAGGHHTPSPPPPHRIHTYPTPPPEAPKITNPLRGGSAVAVPVDGGASVSTEGRRRGGGNRRRPHSPPAGTLSPCRPPPVAAATSTTPDLLLFLPPSPAASASLPGDRSPSCCPVDDLPSSSVSQTRLRSSGAADRLSARSSWAGSGGGRSVRSSAAGSSGGGGGGLRPAVFVRRGGSGGGGSDARAQRLAAHLCVLLCLAVAADALGVLLSSAAQAAPPRSSALYAARAAGAAATLAAAAALLPAFLLASDPPPPQAAAVPAAVSAGGGGGVALQAAAVAAAAGGVLRAAAEAALLARAWAFPVLPKLSAAYCRRATAAGAADRGLPRWDCAWQRGGLAYYRAKEASAVVCGVAFTAALLLCLAHCFPRGLGLRAGLRARATFPAVAAALCVALLGDAAGAGFALPYHTVAGMDAAQAQAAASPRLRQSLLMGAAGSLAEGLGCALALALCAGGGGGGGGGRAAAVAAAAALAGGAALRTAGEVRQLTPFAAWPALGIDGMLAAELAAKPFSDLLYGMAACAFVCAMMQRRCVWDAYFCFVLLLLLLLLLFLVGCVRESLHCRSPQIRLSCSGLRGCVSASTVRYFLCCLYVRNYFRSSDLPHRMGSSTRCGRRLPSLPLTFLPPVSRRAKASILTAREATRCHCYSISPLFSFSFLKRKNRSKINLRLST